MQEDRAHALHQAFAAVDAGARFKQGIGFAGRGVPARLPGGYNEEQDDDVIARNRRIRAALYPGSFQEQAEREEQEEGYDSDTAEAVQRRLAQLKKEQRPRAAERLPDRLYDERREQQQLRQLKEQQRERRRSRSRSREQEQRRPGSASREPQRRRSRSREPQRRRSRSRSRDRRGDHRRRRSRSRDERGDRYRGYDSRRRSRDRRRHVGGRRSRSRGRRERSRSQDRRQGGDERQRGGGGGAAPVLQQYDFEALIPGYQGMSVVQKMRAKTQYLLERSAAQDERRERSRQEDNGSGGGSQPQWTRFRFDAGAELEEDRAAPPAVGPGMPGLGEGSEDGKEDEDDASLLDGLNAVTFQGSHAAAVQQERDESHAAAIFGGGHAAAPAGRKFRASSAGSKLPSGGRGQAGGVASAAAAPRAASASAQAQGAAGGAGASVSDLLALAEADGAVVVPAEELAAAGASSQLIQQAGGTSGNDALSWRDRALAAKRAKQQQQ